MSKKTNKETKVSKFLYEEIEEQIKNGSLILKDIPNYLLSNLSPKFNMRDYQEEAFRYFITYLDTSKLHNNNQIHLLFHMATGSGKTYIMAGAILHLYKKGYRNFLFFVNDKNIIEKTKANFLDKYYSKYLFNEKILIDGNEVEINQVDNFTKQNDNSINIKFTSVQKLHKDLDKVKENSITIKDFEDKNVVLIADEAHHINSDTKNNLNEEDLAIGISYSGTSKDTVEVIKRAKNSGAKTLIITNFEKSMISNYADVVIHTSNSKNDIYGNAIFSRTSQIVIVDMLYMGVILSDYNRFSKTLDINGEISSHKSY